MGVLLVTGILKEITCLQAVADDEACKYGYESWIAYCYKTNYCCPLKLFEPKN